MTLFLIKHFLADFPLQTAYMLGKGKPTGWVLPLAAHCAVHALLTLPVLWFLGLPLWLAAAEFVAHFIIDRVKARTKWTPAQPQFWWALGADQLAHQLCYLAMLEIPR